MDKSRRNRKTSPTRKVLPATSTHEAAKTSSSTSAATKFTIQQKIATATSHKKGPHSVKRTVDPNEVFIKRRIGEGAKPLFSRDELRRKRSPSPKPKRKRTPSSSSSSSSSSSPEVRRRFRTEKPKSQPIKKKSPEKVPYFLDQKRETDRIKRVYGSRRSRSLSRDRRKSLVKTTRNRSRSRTKSPPAYIKRRYRSTNVGRRTPSRERYRSRHYRSEYSRSRSRSRERRGRRHSYMHRNESIDERSLPPATQFIPVPVPVDYPYLPPAWGAPMMAPPTRFPLMMRPPIPAQVPFMPRHFHPGRYYMANGYQRGNFRPRH